MEHHGPLLVERTVIDGTHRLGRGQLSLGEEAVRCQQTEVDEVGVAGKGRKALVGAVPVARRADGEYLPVGLLCGRKEIDEGKGFICPACRCRKDPGRLKTGIRMPLARMAGTSLF